MTPLYLGPLAAEWVEFVGRVCWQSPVPSASGGAAWVLGPGTRPGLVVMAGKKVDD